MLDKLSLRRDKVIKVQKSTKSAESGKDKKVDFVKWRADLIGYVYTLHTELCVCLLSTIFIIFIIISYFL